MSLVKSLPPCPYRIYITARCVCIDGADRFALSDSVAFIVYTSALGGGALHSNGCSVFMKITA